jgi:hypothetical protein
MNPTIQRARTPQSGLIVCLNGARITTPTPDDDTGELIHKETLAFGLFMLVEHLPYEPSNYVWEEGWLIAPDPSTTHPDTTGETEMAFISSWDLFAELDPQGYGHNLAEDRRHENYMEDHPND